MKNRPVLLIVVGGALALNLGSACSLVGNIGGTPDEPKGGGGGGGAGGNSAAPPGTPLPARVRRQMPAEYRATVSAALGTDAWPSIAFPNDSRSDGYLNRAAELRVTAALAQNLWDGVPAVATQAAAKLMSAPPCQPNGTSASDDDACATKLLTSFVTAAYRRAPAPDEMADLLTAFHAGKDGADFTAGLTTALEVVLQSAGILYRTELGTDGAGATTRMTGTEIADELAYLVTGGPPDATLSAAAAAGTLDTADGRAQHLGRLLATPAARGPVGAFAAQWLEIVDLPAAVRDPATFPAWGQLRGSELAGTQAFFTRAVLDEKADLATLFSANWTTADAMLAPLYGGTAGDRMVPGNPHAGVLTEASVLAAHAQNVDSSPIQRGHMVRVRLLCQSIPPPPATLVINPPKPDPTRTTRERFAAHIDSPDCRSCHALMDPIGYGLENFDAVGAYRATDNGKPVDASGTLVGSDVDGPFDGPVELGAKLAQSQVARDCFARHWLSYASARAVDDATWASLKGGVSSFTAGSASVIDLMTAFVRSEAFVVRVRP